MCSAPVRITRQIGRRTGMAKADLEKRVAALEAELARIEGDHREAARARSVVGGQDRRQVCKSTLTSRKPCVLGEEYRESARSEAQKAEKSLR